MTDDRVRPSVKPARGPVRPIYIDRNKPTKNTNDIMIGKLPMDQMQYMTTRSLDPIMRLTERYDYNRSSDLMKSNDTKNILRSRPNLGKRDMILDGDVSFSQRFSGTILMPTTTKNYSTTTSPLDDELVDIFS